MASSPDLIPDYLDNPAELVERLKKVATTPRDWRPDAMPFLMWQAACLIEWYAKERARISGTRYELVPTSGGQFAEIRFVDGVQE